MFLLKIFFILQECDFFAFSHLLGVRKTILVKISYMLNLQQEPVHSTQELNNNLQFNM